MESIEKFEFVDLFSPELENMFDVSGKVYRRKIEPIKGAREVVEGEVVETRLLDGTLESTQEAKPGDWIITGSKGEEFIFTSSKFNNLYEKESEGVYVPKERKIVAIPNPFGKPVRISAPWGTPEKPAFQDGSEKAILVAELSSDGNKTTDRYIIGDEEMLLNNYE